MDSALIERLARLRGIGDAYHDYRGELKHFSLETKKAILRAMGCTVDEPRCPGRRVAAHSTLLVAAISCHRWPPRAARASASMSISLRAISAPRWLWSVSLEDGSQHAGVNSTADCPEVWRGEVEGSWITRRRFELPIDLPPGYHELEANIAGGARGSLPSDHLAAAMLRAAADCRRRAAVGSGGAALYAALARQLGHRRFRRSGIADPLGSLARRGIHRLESPARARAGGSRSAQSLQRIEPAFPQCAVYRGTAVPEFEDCIAAQRRGCAEPSIAQRLCGLRGASLSTTAASRSSNSNFSSCCFATFAIGIWRTIADVRRIPRLRRRRRRSAADACALRCAGPIFPRDAWVSLPGGSAGRRNFAM